MPCVVLLHIFVSDALAFFDNDCFDDSQNRHVWRTGNLLVVKSDPISRLRPLNLKCVVVSNALIKEVVSVRARQVHVVAKRAARETDVNMTIAKGKLSFLLHTCVINGLPSGFRGTNANAVDIFIVDALGDYGVKPERSKTSKSVLCAALLSKRNKH